MNPTDEYSYRVYGLARGIRGQCRTKRVKGIAMDEGNVAELVRTGIFSTSKKSKKSKKK